MSKPNGIIQKHGIWLLAWYLLIRKSVRCPPRRLQ